ncbi:uncharacterized protein LOC108231641 [Kryptolebias marmoratus]|uniref:uncharacterized protein LOC108231641 n=1 Tax=Kryptolebias marmoratus TaxID=37003 RepID=UPI0007F90750|nr:uncharacterized protein LOC108231641 [Kryptolebias marmoratus]
MDGVLESAVALCLCKLFCSLLFVPSLVVSYGPVSFCCCCLLIFTDFLVTVSLSLLWICESWVMDLSPSGDVIALRFLLFLSHTYGAVIFLITFLIALEALIRLLWPHLAVDHRRASQTEGFNQQGWCVRKANAKEAEEDNRSLLQVVSFFCCLSVWFFVALNVRWHWKVEEAWAAVCLHTTDSLVRCLPNALSPSPVNLCWSILFLLVLLLIIGTCLQRRCQVPAQVQKTNGRKPCGCCGLNPLPALSAPLRGVHPGMSVPEPEDNSGNSAYSCDSVQMLVRNYGDFVLASTHCLSEKGSGQEHERTKRGVPLAFITEKHVDSHHRGGRWLWGFPDPGGNLIIGLVSVLSLFTLPFNLSVNILLIRTIDSLLDWCVRSLLSSAANIRDTSASHSVTQV